MTIETSQDVSDSANQQELDFDDLDNFSSSFFGQDESAPKETKPEEKSEEAEDTAADDQHVDEEPEEDASEDGDTEESDDKPKKPVSRYQERINELTNARREAERREADLLKRLEALETQKDGSTPTPNKTVSQDTAPSPSDQNEDGSDKYPLGEFDPNFIRDLTKHTIAEAQKEADTDRTRRLAEEAEVGKRQALQAEWTTRQDSAKSRYSDYSESVQSLESVFTEVDPAYGDYLASVVMEMDKGPEVLYYLSKNPDEAREIVSLSANKAVTRLGRLEARFDETPKEDNKPQTKVSKAPEPPVQNKGSAGGRRVIPDDTDDLDLFWKKFQKKA